jgi:predicted lipid-binding transport protein (Tim44 family)
LGVLLQLLIAYSVAVWVYRRFAEGLSPVGTGLYGRIFYPPARAPSVAAKPGFFGGGRTGRPITLTPADFRSFEELLHCMQTAWSAHDLDSLRSMTTPEMAQSYARQLADQQARGIRNQVTEVRLQQADACEAWSDGRRDFATVSMQFSMVDVLRDKSGRIVDGSETERVSVRQYWRFTRTMRARWIVSAVEETR